MDDQVCGCCEGTQVWTPTAVANRPGLSALAYRVGTHARFFETMKARLSSQIIEPLNVSGEASSQPTYPLRNLATRASDDPAIALLDGWATVADVLTFYQERIANEGYLRTAIERRSVLELARLVGYRLRPGVASTVYLAYTIDEKQASATAIPVGTRSQSVPNPGELPQTFETSDVLDARADWNALKPRLSKPQNITLDTVLQINTVYFEGTALNLKTNDRLLFVFSEAQGEQVMRRVQATKPLFDSNRTEVTLQPVPFLIVAAVALLRVALAAIEKQLAMAAANKLSANLINWLETARDAVKTILENIVLDNYPPIEADFFSHDRLYGSNARAVAIARLMPTAQRAEINRLFSTPARATTKRRGAAAAAAAKGENFWQSPSALAVANDVLNAALVLAQDPVFQHDLTCFASAVIDQARPINVSDRRGVFSLFTQAEENKWPDRIMAAIGQLQESQKDPDLEQLRVTGLQIINSLIPLLSSAEVFNSLSGLLADLVAISDSEGLNSVHTLIETAQTGLTTLGQAASANCQPTTATTDIDQLIGPLTKPPSLQLANGTLLARKVQTAFERRSDNIPQLMVGFAPRLRDSLYAAWANAAVSPIPSPLKSVYVFRTTAAPFGYNAPAVMGLTPNSDPATKDQFPFLSKPDGDWKPSDARDEKAGVLYLDVNYDAIVPDSYVVLQNETSGNLAARVEAAQIHPRTAYTLSGKTTELTLSRSWWNPASDSMQKLRATTVHAVSEKLTLSTRPYTPDIQGTQIELDELYDGLASGRWLIISGERADVHETTGVTASELVMVANVAQQFDATLPGDKTCTTITLATALAYRYKRETVTLYGNVVKATNGETRHEILGNGDGSKAFQAFDLKQPPLTYVAAPNPAGVDSTLKVFVNEVEWHAVDDLVTLDRTAHNFVTRTDDAGKTTVVFGDGQTGARLPTGAANIRAEYRNGIGRSGNVQAKQISLLVSRPLGVKDVINPLRASGGADKETRDQARKNVPLAVTALDRLVSVQDYADFARTFAGIAKASAQRLSSGQRELVHLTIAGIDDVPIDSSSDLYRNLVLALRRYGDPDLPIQVDLREWLALVISARLYLQADYVWEKVVGDVRAKLLDTFSFDRRELGQDAVLSEAIAAIQTVPGVAYVDVDVFGAVPDKIADANGQRRLRTPSEIAAAIDQLTDPKAGGPPQPQARVRVDLAGTQGGLHPAQLAYLSPQVPDTLILNRGA